jgi:putative transcriptional regulator
MGNYSLGNNLKVHRARKNLTQEELAGRVGVTRPTINFIENGRFVPSTLLALKIARIFEVPFEEVFFLENISQS